MGNCQHDGQQQKIFDDKHTVDSQDYQKASNNKQNDQHLFPVEKQKMNNKKKEPQYQAQSYTFLNDSPYTFIRRPAPNFQGVAYHNGFKKISLRDFKGQYVVLFFFPYDFSEMCRKEILAFSDLNDKFQKAACQVIGCSQDSQFAHMNYCQKKRNEGGLGNLEIPLLSDVDRQISTSYGVVIEDGEAGEKGASYRSTFIIDQHLILRHMSINDIAISVNPEEVLRLVYTFQQNDRENPLKGGGLGGCPFAAQAKEMQSNQDIDTFSRYQRKKSDDGSNKNESAKQTNNDKKSSRVQPTKNEEKQESLIIRLGGEEVVQDIADKYVSYVFSDPLLKPFFMNISNQSKQKKAVGQFLKTYFGSPSQYLGRNMRDAHKDLHLNDDHFNKAAEYIKTILKDMNIKAPLIQEVMMLIEPLRSQITQKSTQSLYERVGRESGIKKAVQFYFNKILQINEIKPYYSKVDQEKIQDAYVQYLSLVFGGPAKYKGKQMRDAHTPLHIPERIFNFCLLQIQHAFKENGVDTNSFHEIGRLLECLRSEIPKKNNTLYERLGGQVVIEKSVKKVYDDRILNEPKIKEFFKNADMKALGQKMTDFYIMITGGPNKYQGKSAKDAHKSFNIMSNQFDIYKNLLKDSFLENGSTKESVQEFINLIDTIKIDVIGGKPPSLYEKIGGEDTVLHFSDKLFEKIMEEKRIRHYFINVDIKSVKMHFKEFLLMATGGPSKYQGQNIRDLHEQMDISEKDFNVFMEVVKDTVGTIKIKEELQPEVLNFFESMRQMIVTVDD